MEIGAVLAEARKRAGIAQKDLARRLGISPQYLSDMEQGRRAFGDKFLPDLPPEIYPEVRAAFRAQYEKILARYGDDDNGDQLRSQNEGAPTAEPGRLD